LSPVAAKQQKEDLNRRYTILKPDGGEAERRRPPTSPCVIDPLTLILLPTHFAITRPKVLSAKDLPPKIRNPDFKMFDAVLATDKLVPPAVDSEMEKFLPMLNDYLKCRC
jgi:hypothetical protein